MKKLFKSMNDLQYHFSLRKMSVGVCSVVLGLFFVGVNNTQTVKTDVIERTATQVQTKTQQKANESINSNSAVTNNAAAVTPVKETQKVEENNLNISVNNKETETVNSNSTVKSHEETLLKTTESQSKDNTNSEKTDSVLAKQSENDAQKQTQSVETNTLDLNSSNFESNANVATSLLASKAMFYYVPYGGWENHNGKMYYRDWDGNYLRNQWAAPTGTTHYFGREGYTINNQWYTMPDNNTYYFDHTGHTVKNRWYTLPNTKTYYFDNTGHTVKNRWYTVSNNTTYYFDNFGHTVKNRWYNVSNNTYYFDNYGHTVKNRWYTLSNSKTYYFDTFGHTVKGRWYTLTNGSTYYFDTFGHTVKNRWYSIPNSSTYYFDNFGHTVKNRWYNIANGGTYYFDNEGHTVKNRYYTLNGTRYWFDNNGHSKFADRYIHQNGLTIDTATMNLSGKRNGSSDIFVLDPMGNEKRVASTYDYDPNFNFDASDYAGETITLITRNGYNTTDREIGSRQSIYIPKLSFSNVKIDQSNTNVSGKVNGSSNVFVLDPMGNEKRVASSYDYDEDFNFDASDYAGETITLITRNGYNTTDREIGSRQSIYIPKLSFSNVKIDQSNTNVSGKVNGSSNVFVLDPMGNEKRVASSYDYDEDFNFDASDYAGETITLITRNGYNTTDREIGNRQSIYIPYL